MVAALNCAVFGHSFSGICHRNKVNDSIEGLSSQRIVSITLHYTYQQFFTHRVIFNHLVSKNLHQCIIYKRIVWNIMVKTLYWEPRSTGNQHFKTHPRAPIHAEILHPEICCFMFNPVVFDVGKILPQSYK